MDLESIRLFVLAAEKLNISAAGRSLGLAPAVASARLAKLETSLGADLLHRSTRKVALSLEGAEFLPFAKEMLAQEAAARAALGLGDPQASGTLRFTAPSSFAQLYIAPILPEFLERHPGLRLDLRLSDAPFDLIEGSFDLALRNSALQDSSMKGRKLADDTRILCAAPSYLERFGVPETPEDLKSHHLMAFRDRAPRALIGPDGARAMYDPAASGSRLTMDHGLTHRNAAKAGAGICINAVWNIHEDLAAGRLIRVLPGWRPAEEAALWLVYPKSNVLTTKVRVFIDYLLEKIGKAPPWLQAP